MERTSHILLGFVAASLIFGPTGGAQSVTKKAPTAADWASLAKLPDFNGVWQSAPGGGGGRGDAAAKGGRAGRSRGELSALWTSRDYESAGSLCIGCANGG